MSDNRRQEQKSNRIRSKITLAFQGQMVKSQKVNSNRISGKVKGQNHLSRKLNTVIPIMDIRLLTIDVRSNQIATKNS